LAKMRPMTTTRTKPWYRKAWGRLLYARYRLFSRTRYNDYAHETVHDVSLFVLPGVFNPRIMRSGTYFAEHLERCAIGPGVRVLDMGTGSGVCAVFAARRGAQVVAVDINPAAVRCTRINALANHVENTLDAREGDLFEPVCGERFDFVLFNPPFFRGAPKDALDQAWRGEDVLERFAAGLRKHLLPGGHALLLFSTDNSILDLPGIFARAGLRTEIAAQRDFINEVMTIYRLCGESS
jgi:release factor glutamine methyltransferase